MTNAEYYKEYLRNHVITYGTCTRLAIFNDEPYPCDLVFCIQCDLNKSVSCTEERVKWLLSEHRDNTGPKEN